MATFSTEGTVGLGECSSKSSSYRDQQHSIPIHQIFLSHAGTEKDFVEQLYEDLENIYPRRIFFDKDGDSLPKGEKFPNRMFFAARECQVAVVVMSESYFTRKWPMQELATFVQAQSQFSELKVLPLFYKLSVEEFKQQERQDKWFKGWETWTGTGSKISTESLQTWKDAIRSIYSENGIQFIVDGGEVEYRKKIVRAICKLVPPVTQFDVSHVEGKERIRNFFQEKLEPLDEVSPPCFLGMYGMGGMGKTTMSRVLCNEYSPEFLAKVSHVELNSDNSINLQKKLLRTLTNWKEDYLTSKVTDENQGRNLLIEHVSRHRLFLVLDNVWDQLTSIEEAKSYLSLPFKEGSVVLVTARTLGILKLLRNVTWKDCFLTPFLDTQAATNLFLNCAGYNLSQLTLKQKALTETFVATCYFSLEGDRSSQEYHPLALKVLGGYIGQHTSAWENIKIDLKNVGVHQEIDPLFSVLEIGWEALSSKCRTIFLDLVLHTGDVREQVGKNLLDLEDWYCTVFDMDSNEFSESLEILTRRCLLNRDPLKYWGVSVHDLYIEFATLNARTSTHSRRCILHGKGDEQYYHRKRVTIRSRNMTKLTKRQLCECSTQVELLRVVNCKYLTTVDLRGMTDLLSIKLIGCDSLEQVCIDDLENLVWLHMEGCLVKTFPSMKGLVSLLFLKLWELETVSTVSTACDPPDLRDCTSLQRVEMNGYSKLLKFPDLGHAENLRMVHGSHCKMLKMLPGLSKLTGLQNLDLIEFGLIDIPNLGFLNKLETLSINDCSELNTLPDLGNLTLLHNVNLYRCSQLECFPGLSKDTNLTLLRRLNLAYCRNLKSCVAGLSKLRNLESLDLSDCSKLKWFPNVRKLTNLVTLDLSGCTQFCEIDGLDNLQVLRHLSCDNTSIRYLPDLSMLTELTYLNVSNTPIESIGSTPRELVHLKMRCCPNVTELPDLRSSPAIRIVDISHSHSVAISGFPKQLIDKGILRHTICQQDCREADLTIDASITLDRRGFPVTVQHRDSEVDNCGDGSQSCCFPLFKLMVMTVVNLVVFHFSSATTATRGTERDDDHNGQP